MKTPLMIVTMLALAAGALTACGKQGEPNAPGEPAAQTTTESGEMPEKDAMQGMPMPQEGASNAASHATKGTIQGIDPNAGTVKIAHEAVPSLKWPAMTMDFKVQDQNALSGLKEGAPVEFTFTESAPGQYVITEISSPND